MDRFLMHLYISYTDDLAEREVIRLVRAEELSKQVESETAVKEKPATISQESIFAARKEIAAVTIPEPMEDYIVSLVAGTRRPEELGDELAKYIQVGVSPRGSIGLDKCSRAHAWFNGRSTVTPDDIRAVINDCLRHRLVLSYDAQADGVTCDEVIHMLVKLAPIA